MAQNSLTTTFSEAARAVGASVTEVADLAQVADYVRHLGSGPVVLPAFPSGERLKLADALAAAGLDLVREDFRGRAPQALLGVTGANFALAPTGTVVLESTAEPIRLATTLPEKHVVLVDPRKILADDMAAVPFLSEFHKRQERNFLAYITGPSRTADIERVLTIGVHGPRELHILLLEGLSDDPLEM